MKPSQWATFVILALVLVMPGCASAANPTPIPTVALDPIDSFESSIVQASAEVVPAREAHLSFVISGPIRDLAVEEGSTVEAGQVLAILNSPELEYGVLEAEGTVRVAEFDYEYWKLPRRKGNQIIDRGLVAKEELETTRKMLDTARAELSQTELLAPFAATVISVEVQPGEYVQPGQAVIILAELDNLRIETTDLSELNVAQVEIGQPATVYVEALDNEFQGQVTAISPVSDSVGGDVVFKVTVQLNEQPPALLWGMSADIEIQTEQ